MRSAGHLALLSVCAAAWVLGGCRIPGQPALDLDRTAASAEDRVRVGSWLERARGAHAERTSVRAYARVRLASPELGGARVREVIAAQRPARLRVETLNFLGQTQSLLVADDGESTFFDGRELVTGVPAIELLAQLGLDLTPAQAIDLLLATPELPDRRPTDVWTRGDEHIAEFPTARVRFASDGALRGVDAFDAGGALWWVVEYDRWSPVEGGRYPLSIRAYFPRTELRAEFELEDVVLNAELGSELFRVQRSLE